MAQFFDTISPAGDRDEFAIFLNAGVTYYIELEGSATSQGTLGDPFVSVFSSFFGLPFSLLASDDDSGRGVNSRLLFTPTTSATYIVQAGEFGDNASGSYRLRINADDRKDSVEGVGALGSVIAGASGTSGNINFAGDADVFSVFLTAGQQYFLEQEGSATGFGTISDPLLRLLNTFDGVIASDDDGGVGNNARIVFTPTTTGNFFLSAQGFGGNVGTFQLFARPDDFKADAPSEFTVGPYGAVTTNGTATGNINYVGDADVFATTLVSGLSYTAELRGSATGDGTLGDPFLRVRNAAFAQIASDDDSGFGVNSLATFTANAGTGTYYIGAEEFGNDSTGTYRVFLSAGNATAGNDIVNGSGASDAIKGLGGNDSILGGSGNDSIAGGDGNDTVRGFDGDDSLVGGSGSDSLVGGAGFDTVDYSGLGVAVSLAAGGVLRKGALGTDTLGAFNVFAGTIETFERVIGAVGQDNLLDNSAPGPISVDVDLAAQTIAATVLAPIGGFPAGATFGFQVVNFTDVIGSGNDDEILGDGANNTFFGSAGDDTLQGRGGFDIVDYSDLGVAVSLAAGGVLSKGVLGTDTLGAFNVGAGIIETLERVIGAAGQDNLLDNSAPGPISVNVNLTAQTILATVLANLGGFPAGATFGFEVVNFVDVFGTINDDSIIGNVQNNSFDGGAGDDTLTGLGGNDSLIGGGGLDSMSGGDGADTLRAFDGNDTLTGGLGGDSLQGGIGFDRFDFNSKAEAPLGAAGDKIAPAGAIAFDNPGAAAGDIIDLSTIDANETLAANQKFAFNPSATVGTLRCVDVGAVTRVLGFTNNVAGADFQIDIQDGAAFNAANYTSLDFVL